MPHAPSPEQVGAPPTQALEQVVAELLEPVIRQWLRSNLPRLIEKAVREEVVRAWPPSATRPRCERAGAAPPRAARRPIARR